MIKSSAEVITDPQAIAHESFTEIDHPEGPTKLIHTPIRFVQSPASVRIVAPDSGQDNEGILPELGYDSEDIAGKRKRGIIP